ncbi:MAG: hypothetical protein ABR520_07115 [Mycobacteriales bacterium]|nr:hypothetical protein [Frankia sp.]
MSWQWRYDGPTASSDTTSSSFPTQAEAELWLGESWQELLDGGVRAVTLYEDEREVYGPMSLEPA